VLQTVNRAGQVLDLFSAEDPEWGATSVARALDIAKSQAHALLVALSEIGLLQRVRRGRYRLGWRIVMLNSLLWRTSEVNPEILRVMRALAERYGETVQLAAWGGDQAICIAVCEGGLSVVVVPAVVGSGLPAHSTGPGKILLASRPVDEIRDLLARDPLERMTHRTIVSARGLREELDGVRRRGFAYEDEEHAPDTCGVAAPIVDARGEVLAAVSISAPAHRWRPPHDGPGDDEYTRVVVAAASYSSRLARHRGLAQEGRNEGGPALRDAFAGRRRPADRVPATSTPPTAPATDLQLVRNSRTSP
jgi:DNA-binding IclR family transcriptional regulator